MSSGLVHLITSAVPDGDLIRWTCACGTWGKCEPTLADQITADHLAADDTVGPTAVHAANVLRRQADQR